VKDSFQILLFADNALDVFLVRMAVWQIEPHAVGLLVRGAGSDLRGLEDGVYKLLRGAPHGAVALPFQDPCAASWNRIANPPCCISHLAWTDPA
jgi:hypothetical protein